MGARPDPGNFTSTAEELPSAQTITSTVMIDTAQFAPYEVAFLVNLLTKAEVAHHLVNFMKPIAAWTNTNEHTLEAMMTLTRKFFEHAICYGTLPEARLAFAAGLCQYVSLAGHTTEGAFMRDVLRSMKFTKPYGLFTVCTTLRNSVPFIVTREASIAAQRA